MLASDGIFDKLSDEDIGKAVWLTCDAAKQLNQNNGSSQAQSRQASQTRHQNPESPSSISVHQFSGLGVESILKNSLMRQSLDNVTVVMVAFQNFKRIVCGQSFSTNSADKREAQGEVRSSSKKPEGKAGTGFEKENINSINNKRISAARSHQTLQPPFSQTSADVSESQAAS